MYTYVCVGGGSQPLRVLGGISSLCNLAQLRHCDFVGSHVAHTRIGLSAF
jgi:hypothetical protein